MRHLRILTVLLWSFSASSQPTEELKCFTITQVKEFLVTKIELNNCLESYNSMAIDLAVSNEEKAVLIGENEKLDTKVKRNRRVAIGVGVLAALEGVVIGLSLK